MESIVWTKQDNVASQKDDDLKIILVIISKGNYRTRDSQKMREDVSWNVIATSRVRNQTIVPGSTNQNSKQPAIEAISVAWLETS